MSLRHAWIIPVHSLEEWLVMAQPALPFEILRQVIGWVQDLPTLARLARVSSALYEHTISVLYAHVHLRSGSAASLLDVGHTVQRLGPYSEPSQTGHNDRPICRFRHVKTLTIHSLPVQSLCDSIDRITTFPDVATVHIVPSALDALRSARQDVFGLVARIASPRRLVLEFPVCPAEQWQEHRDESTEGAHALITRLSKVRAHWTRLETLEVKGIVHQILPSFGGVHNTYHFAPPNPAFNKPRNEPGAVTVAGLATADTSSDPAYTTENPGPAWPDRAWQCIEAIKTPFPSGGDASKWVGETSWTFVDVANHLSVTDNPQIDELIKSTVEYRVPAELVSRRGVTVEHIGRIMERVEFDTSAISSPRERTQ